MLVAEGVVVGRSHESASRGSDTRNSPSVFDDDYEFSVFYDEAA